MLKLIQNEWMKLWAQKTAWILVIILAVIAILPAIIEAVTSDISYDNGMTWQENEQILLDESLALYEETGDEYFKESALISEYRLANDISPLSEMSTLDYLQYGANLMSLVTIMAVIITAAIVSSEFQTGTIKMLLTRPVSRAKVLTSKLATVFLYGLLLYGFALAFSYLIGLIFFDNIQNVQLVVENGAVIEKLANEDLGKYILYSFSNFIMSILFAFMIGSVFRSSSLAIGLTLAISFFSSLVVLFLAKYEIVKYIWITHTDLTQYLYGTTIVPDITIGLSLAVLAVYAVIFVVVSYLVFVKRDVKA